MIHKIFILRIKFFIKIAFEIIIGFINMRLKSMIYNREYPITLFKEKMVKALPNDFFNFTLEKLTL